VHAVRTKTPQQSEKILTVAARLFASHRFHETRMEDISAAAEVGKGTLYRYFKDKDELYTALLVRAADQLEEQLQKQLETAQDTRGKLEAIVFAIINYFDEQPHLLDLIQHAEAMKRSDRIFAWQKQREKNFGRVRDILAAAEANGEFSMEDPGFASLFLLCGLRAVLRFSKPPRADDLARQIVDHFLHGHARPAAETNGRTHPAAELSI
jgi:AcrR family transcriptional regulator